MEGDVLSSDLWFSNTCKLHGGGISIKDTLRSYIFELGRSLDQVSLLGMLYLCPFEIIIFRNFEILSIRYCNLRLNDFLSFVINNYNLLSKVWWLFVDIFFYSFSLCTLIIYIYIGVIYFHWFLFYLNFRWIIIFKCINSGLNSGKSFVDNACYNYNFQTGWIQLNLENLLWKLLFVFHV